MNEISITFYKNTVNNVIKKIACGFKKIVLKVLQNFKYADKMFLIY